MRISIAERLKPFTHVMGTSTILPGWGCLVQIFPCLIRLHHLKGSLPVLLDEFSLDLKGPVQQFTVCNDLEKGRMTLSGITAEGWMRYHLISAKQTENVRLVVDRAPGRGIAIQNGGMSHVLQAKEEFNLLNQETSFESYQVPLCDRLSLGNHKAQDWELIKRRFSLSEILPLVHRLGQLIPSMPPSHCHEGTLALLEACEQSFTTERPEKGEETWHHFLRGCFQQLLVPQLVDGDHQGLSIKQPLFSNDISPLVILSEASRLIRKLFVQQENHTLSILPYLLPSLHHGRLIDVSVEGGKLSIEWTKKSIRQLIFHAEKDQEWIFKFRSDVKSYRLRQHVKEKGERQNCGAPVSLKKKCCYLFDNFQ